MELVEFHFLLPTQVSMFSHQNHPSQTCHSHELLREAAPAREQIVGIRVPQSMKATNYPLLKGKLPVIIFIIYM
jgi:hypothetical protein